MNTIEYLKQRRKKKITCQVKGKVKTSRRVAEIGKILVRGQEERDLMEVERPPLIQAPMESLGFLF